MRPFVAKNVRADRVSISRLVGPRLRQLFVPRATVSTYDLVLVFKQQVVLSNQLRHALEKYGPVGGTSLLAGRDFTVEALALGEQRGCHILCDRVVFWTDATWRSRNSK